MRKLSAVTVCVLLFLLCLSIADAGVEKVSNHIELISGCSRIVNISVDNTLNRDLKIHISTEIFPDGEGITVTYYPTPPFVLNRNENIIVEMVIDTNISLMPQQYVIETSFFYEDYSYKISKKYTSSSVTITEDTDNETILPDDEVNETEDEVIIANIVIGNGNGYAWLIWLPIIVVAVVSLLFYFRKSKEDEKK